MLRSIVFIAAIVGAVGLSCQLCGAQEPAAQPQNPQAGFVLPAAQGAPATQPADGGNFVRSNVMVTSGTGGVTVTLGEPGAGNAPATQPVPPPPGQVRRTWHALGGKDEPREEGGENGIFINGRQIGSWGAGQAPGMQHWMMTPAQPVKMEKAAYLGLSTSPVTEELASQLGLAKGVGLLVDVVDENGPAKKAGLEKFDVLTRIEDQIVINSPQLQVLVRMHKAGDEVKLTVFRKAKETVLPVKLVEKELPVLQPFWGMGPEMRTHRLDAVEHGEGAGNEMELQTLRDHMQGMLSGERTGGPFAVSSMLADKDNVITAKTDPTTGKTTLTATDAKSGKMIFTGPINTPEERKAVPPEILKKWEAMRIEMRPPAPGMPAGPGAPGSPAPSKAPGTTNMPPNPAPPANAPTPPAPPA